MNCYHLCPGINAALLLSLPELERIDDASVDGELHAVPLVATRSALRHVITAVESYHGTEKQLSPPHLARSNLGLTSQTSERNFLNCLARQSQKSDGTKKNDWGGA